MRRLLLTGLLVSLPVVATIYVALVLFRFFDDLSQPIILGYFGREIPGLGVILTILACLGVGLLATNFLGKRLLEWTDTLMSRLPVVGVVYSATRRVTRRFLEGGGGDFERAVFIEYPHPGQFTLGFQVKRVECPSGPIYVVFMPFFPGTSGTLLFLHESRVYACPLSLEEAVRTVVSGGTLTPQVWHEDIVKVVQKASG